MCAGVIWPEDRSSYNLYVQGGIGEDGKTFGETYILSLPSFQWTLISPELHMIPNTAYGKGWSSCDVVRNSQMLVIGGYAANKSWPQCDVPGFGGQHGLLLGQEYVEVDRPKFHWWWRLWHEFNEYRVPDKIVSLVGGNVTGHATKTAPLQGWATSSLSAYFKGENYIAPRTATRSIPQTSTAAPSIQPVSSDSHVGAIAGGTIGGVIALLVIIAAVVLCLRRRHRKNAPRIHSELDANARSELDNLSVAQKHSANYSVAEDRPYYASPADHHLSTTAIGRMNGQEMRAELPDSTRPSSVEMPDVRSPVGGELSAVGSLSARA
jgi:hypothetical protein